MKTRIIPIVLVMLAVTIADSMETVDKLRPPRSDMLITYETRKDSKGDDQIKEVQKLAVKP